MAGARPPLALLAALALALAAACTEERSDCPRGQELCGETCLDPATYPTNPLHCGGCGIPCGFGTCVDGTCQCEGGALCRGQLPRCAHLDVDPDNCGQCGAACPRPGEGCADSVCGCYPPADGDCGTYCADFSRDAANCGGCGNVCTLANEVCDVGDCACPASLPHACPVDSPTTCVNLATDARNCGACGYVCPLVNDVCSGGECDCPSSLPDECPAGTPTTCVDLATDERNCGACGNTCLADQVCVDRACAWDCPAGETLCETETSARCVDLDTDEENCGTCGSVCPPGATCLDRECRCPAGPTGGCGGTCCGGGDACCTSGCQTQHSNALGAGSVGLGQSYFSCDPLFTHTREAALRAADAWSAGATSEGTICGPGCIARQTDSQCAVWCHAESGHLAGRVGFTPTLVCTDACPYGAYWTWD